MHPSALDDEIEQLRYMFLDAKSGNARWKDVWAQVAKIRSGFRDVRYPTRDERDTVWARFQSILSEIEQQKEEAERERVQRASVSQGARARVADLIHYALTFDPTAGDMLTNLMGLALPGTNFVYAFEGPFITRKKQILLTRSKYMKEAWDTFKNNKGAMSPADRSELFGKLKHAQGVLDAEWEEWKDAQEREFDERKAASEIRRAEKERRHEEYLERQRVREERHANWRRRVEENIDKNRARAARLYEVLENKAGHLARFEGHLATARSDEFRQAMEEKIESISAEMAEIKSKIERIEEYIEEDRQKLRDAD